MFDPGAAVGPYRIESVLGEGGMGVVYRALDIRLNRPVAMKFLSSELATATERRRFQREAQTASSLNHPHIVTVHDAGEFEGHQYLVTELADGGTLLDWAHGGRRSWRDVIELLTGVADALATAHEAGILHRDIKPDNVLLTKSGYAKLADFGLARIEAGPQAVTRTMLSDATRQGTILGTVAYMSPEQASGQSLDSRSDIFSFGVVLYELLAGRRPFAGRSNVDVMHAIVHDPAPALPPALPASLRLAVEKSLEKDPANRYQSMRELIVDLRRITRQSGRTTVAPGATARLLTRPWPWIAVAMGLLAVVSAGVWVLWRPAPPPVPMRQEYVALTSFSDSAVSPTISPDGRILAFIRGESTFSGPGDIYVKLLPDGEPSPLTRDGAAKMGPLVFSPDGSRIAYTVNYVNTWSVPVLGGEPTRMMANAAGLSWIAPAGTGPPHVMYSAMLGEGIHMGVFTATESRGDERPLYVPADVNGMVHRSSLSPDGKSVLAVEMDMLGWRPCRLVPFDGSSAGRPVGPVRSQCTDAAWSPDGRWMYLSANTGNGFHIWRQRFPDGRPEQITYTATEEQGIGLAPDGRSIVTSIGERQSTLWLHSGDATHQVTSEGFAYTPSFSTDGQRFYYLQRTRADRRFVSGELWTVDLETGTRQRLLADRQIENYDVSPDGTRVAFIGVDDSGRSSVWDAALDGSAPPRRLSSFEGLRVLYGPAGDLYFVGGETTSLYLYRISQDGRTVRKVVEAPANYLYDVSPDDHWVAAWVGATVTFYPVAGGAPVLLCSHCGTAGEENRGVTPPIVRWSKDGRFMYLHSTVTQRTYVLKLRPGELVPRLPPDGVAGIADAARLLGATPIPEPRAFVSQDPAVYAFPRVTTHRNIYRVPVQ